MVKQEYDLQAIRKQVRQRVERDRMDPNEFRAPKAEAGKPAEKFRFYILPPFQKSDQLATGPAARSMGEFFIQNGAHWITRKRFGCPRVIAEQVCEICDYGFALIKETDNKDERSKIAKDLLAGAYYMVNIYFPPMDTTPEPLRGKVKWYNCPKTVFDMWMECLYRDDAGGDAEHPEPFGVFYAECAAYLFELSVKKVGRGNNYEASRFLTAPGLEKRAIARLKDTPDIKRIEAILAMRHDLFSKIPEIQPQVISQIAAKLKAGGDLEGIETGGFDEDETKQPAKSPGVKGFKPNVSKAAGKAETNATAGEEPVETKPASTKTAIAKTAKTAPKPAPEPEPEPEPESEPVTEPDPQPETAPSSSDDDDVEALLKQLSEG